ncbi:hypothetical protein AK812_SmicGene27738 [Symbiodinium microadriaticum]|uniref:Uncharacterized protein n=1 Tax=Symbiodinium microadriaticum TaxID=2951 RepID=A0A1Q9D653_SYMMI|nr:hypothetical protein AK812_SmicGene27738 [Symbiodinium microadriaticum]
MEDNPESPAAAGCSWGESVTQALQMGEESEASAVDPLLLGGVSDDAPEPNYAEALASQGEESARGGREHMANPIGDQPAPVQIARVATPASPGHSELSRMEGGGVVAKWDPDEDELVPDYASMPVVPERSGSYPRSQGMEDTQRGGKTHHPRGTEIRPPPIAAAPRSPDVKAPVPGGSPPYPCSASNLPRRLPSLPAPPEVPSDMRGTGLRVEGDSVAHDAGAGQGAIGGRSEGREGFEWFYDGLTRVFASHSGEQDGRAEEVKTSTAELQKLVINDGDKDVSPLLAGDWLTLAGLRLILKAIPNSLKEELVSTQRMSCIDAVAKAELEVLDTGREERLKGSEEQPKGDAGAAVGAAQTVALAEGETYMGVSAFDTLIGVTFPSRLEDGSLRNAKVIISGVQAPMPDDVDAPVDAEDKYILPQNNIVIPLEVPRDGGGIWIEDCEGDDVSLPGSGRRRFVAFGSGPPDNNESVGTGFPGQSVDGSGGVLDVGTGGLDAHDDGIREAQDEAAAQVSADIEYSLLPDCEVRPSLHGKAEAEEEVLSEAQPDEEDDLTEVVDPPPRPPSPAPEPPQLRQRRTFLWYHDGTTEIIDDNWLRRGQRPSDRSWRGRTEFLVEWVRLSVQLPVATAVQYSIEL